ncbi:MAG: hypothetical protein AAGJ53_02085 [Pseudomonadota bacterium]
MTRSLRTIATFAVASAIAGLSFASAAQAQSNCATYGKLALKQQRENVQNKCGFSGPSWSPDLRAHVTWCATVGPDQWKTELQKRAEALTKCKA